MCRRRWPVARHDSYAAYAWHAHSPARLRASGLVISLIAA